jgi:hypothetical protein
VVLCRYVSKYSIVPRTKKDPHVEGQVPVFGVRVSGLAYPPI